jgi:hypothetical protein
MLIMKKEIILEIKNNKYVLKYNNSNSFILKFDCDLFEPSFVEKMQIILKETYEYEIA